MIYTTMGVVRFYFLLLLGLLVGLLAFRPAVARQEPAAGPAIISPQAGEAVQGSVPIFGSLGNEPAAGWELLFAYSGDPTDTWFWITGGDQPTTDGKFTDWDTTTLTDGNYTLRLVVAYSDGSRQTADIPGVRVRNYSPIETSTPSLTPSPAPFDTLTPTPTRVPSETPVPPTATALPVNPIEISPNLLGVWVLRGMLAAAAAFSLVGLYALVARISRR